ncbi:hypothetical protein [Paraburkholderia sp. RL17-347-BIC-D]|uniref:hypothetical protein n=1 Tax=Paraburkholderia sp. RL17-347-BIC-D TaxID=3031632 RepID=UPI0038B8E4DC
MTTSMLMPWEGEDELVEAKAAALAVSCGESVAIPAPIKLKTSAPKPAICKPSDLPELGAFVRRLGSLNSLMIFKDLVTAGYLLKREGRYATCKATAGEPVYFISATASDGRHQVHVTPAGEALLRELKRAGKLTRAKTLKPLTAAQRDQRAIKRKQEKADRALKKAEDAAALATSKAEALAKMEQTIKTSIAKREAARAVWQEAGRAQYRQSQQSNQSGGRAVSEAKVAASKPADSQQASKD